jgi:hypothetical protein
LKEHGPNATIGVLPEGFQTIACLETDSAIDPAQHQGPQ